MLLKRKKVIIRNSAAVYRIELKRAKHMKNQTANKFIYTCIICLLDPFWQCGPYRQSICRQINSGLENFIYVVQA